MVDKVFRFLLLLSPIVYGVNINLDKFDMRFFEAGILALFLASLFDKPKRSVEQFKYPIFYLSALLIINSFLNKFQPQDIRSLELMFFGMIGFIIVAKYLSSPEKCYKYIFWALAINIAILILQKIGYSPVVDFGHKEMYKGCEGALLGNNAKFGIYLALLLPYMNLFIAGVLAVTFGAVMIYPQLTIFIPLGIMLYLKNNSFMKRFAICCLAIGLAALYHDKIWASILVRWEVWKPAIALALEKPLIGQGFGTYYLWTGAESFNTYLPFIYGVGILGMAWIIYNIKKNVLPFKANREDIAMCSLLLLGFVEYPFDIPRLWFTLIAIIGFFAIKRIERSAT